MAPRFHATPARRFPFPAFFPATMVAMILVACAGNPESRAERQKQDLTQALVDMGKDVQAGDWERALARLDAQDRGQILGPDGRLGDERKRALSALPYAGLAHGHVVSLRHGKIQGLAACLPPPIELPRDTGQAAGSIAEPPAPGPDEVQADPAENASSPLALRAKAERFFRAVAAKQWDLALSLLHPDERRLLVDAKGKLTDSSRRRLARLDRAAWEGLGLKDGKLVGLGLLLPE